MKKKVRISVGLTILGLLIISYANAQKYVNMDSNPSFLDRVYTGGGFGFSSNANSAYLELSPIVGYMITQKFSAGVGATYQYYNNRFFNADDHRYGGKVFLMQMLIYNFFLYGEYNFINLDPEPWNETRPRETWTRALIGGGFSQPVGKAAFNIMATYDVTWDNTSPYASPWVVGAFFSI